MWTRIWCMFVQYTVKLINDNIINQEDEKG